MCVRLGFSKCVSACVRDVLLKSREPHLTGGEQRNTTAAAFLVVDFHMVLTLTGSMHRFLLETELLMFSPSEFLWQPNHE